MLYLSPHICSESNSGQQFVVFRAVARRQNFVHQILDLADSLGARFHVGVRLQVNPQVQRMVLALRENLYK